MSQVNQESSQHNDCPRSWELASYMRRTIDDDDRQRVEAHLCHCARCARDLGVLYRAVQELERDRPRRMARYLALARDGRLPGEPPSARTSRRAFAWLLVPVAAISLLLVLPRSHDDGRLQEFEQYLEARGPTRGPDSDLLPQLLSPADGEKVSTTLPTLRARVSGGWRAELEEVRFRDGKLRIVGKVLTKSTAVGGIAPSSNLKSAVMYRWRARAEDGRVSNDAVFFVASAATR